ncbi:uncharacterized protein LOC118567373 isoform X2 [Mus musculus]|uniref:uncharacterized protein LOC118567373 isoform X2 n=1 Tax=Mus musculus TaxID=10090 RepID=UPI00167BF64F|nr:uncharacterized protein LOC118567373 isoform X2 [Mus musculus]
MTQSKAIGRMCIPSRSLSPPSCFFWHKLQPGKGVRIQRFPQVLCSDGPYKAGSNGSQGSSAAVLQPVQASKPTVRCLWLWNPLHFGALSQSECPEGEAHLLGRVGEDSPPFPPESECRPPTGRQRRHLSYKDALQVSQPVCPQVLLCSLPWSQVLSSYDRSVLFPVQVLSWASGYLQAASANELLAGPSSASLTPSAVASKPQPWRGCTLQPSHSCLLWIFLRSGLAVLSTVVRKPLPQKVSTGGLVYRGDPQGLQNQADSRQGVWRDKGRHLCFTDMQRHVRLTITYMQRHMWLHFHSLLLHVCICTQNTH